MKVPPLGWLLSRLVDFRSPRKAPEDEREIKRDDEIRKLPPQEQTVQVRVCVVLRLPCAAAHAGRRRPAPASHQVPVPAEAA